VLVTDTETGQTIKPSPTSPYFWKILGTVAFLIVLAAGKMSVSDRLK